MRGISQHNMENSHSNYVEARRKYSSFLTIAYQYVKELNIKAIPRSFELRHIDERALDIWERIWKSHYKKGSPGGWNWRELLRRYRKETAKYVDLAIWSDLQLCGLAIGKLSKSNSHCSIYYVEGCPITHPLKRYILPLTIDFAESVAILVGGNSIRFVNPDENLFAHYEKFGLKLKLNRKAIVRRKRGEFLWRKEGESYYEASVSG